jgi:hypothetical protein
MNWKDRDNSGKMPNSKRHLSSQYLIAKHAIDIVLTALTSSVHITQIQVSIFLNHHPNLKEETLWRSPSVDREDSFYYFPP